MNSNPATIADRTKELKNCTFVKMVLMMIIVLDHAISFWSGNWFTVLSTRPVSIMSELASWLNSFHIYSFTLLSGYLFYYGKYERNRYNVFSKFLCNKVKRLLVPYVFVSIVWVIPITQYFYRYDFIEIIRKYVLAESPSQLWYIWMLFDIFVIFWPLADFFRKHTWIGAGISLGLCLCGYILGSLIPNVFCIATALQFIPYFWIGFTIRNVGLRTTKFISGWGWAGLSLLTHFGALLCKSGSGFVFLLLNLGLSILSHMIGAIMAFVLLQKLANHVHWECTAGAFIAPKSMTVYLIHQQIIYVLIALFYGINPYIHALLNFTIALILSLLIASALTKNRYIRFLLGESR